MWKRIRRFLRGFLTDETGLTQTTEMALLIAATIAGFFALVVAPVSSLVEFLKGIPSQIKEEFGQFADWLGEKLSRLWNRGK